AATDVGAVRRVDLARLLLRAAAGKSRSGLGYSGRLSGPPANVIHATSTGEPLVARAAVKAKQQAKAKAQPAKAVRGRRRRGHSGGGNPNQQLFFMRLRRGQRWLYALLALVFALTFAGVGVGSGTGGLSGLYSGLFGSGSDPVSKANGEIKNHPVKGYRALAT